MKSVIPTIIFLTQSASNLLTQMRHPISAQSSDPNVASFIIFKDELFSLIEEFVITIIFNEELLFVAFLVHVSHLRGKEVPVDAS